MPKLPIKEGSKEKKIKELEKDGYFALPSFRNEHPELVEERRKLLLQQKLERKKAEKQVRKPRTKEEREAIRRKRDEKMREKDRIRREKKELQDSIRKMEMKRAMWKSEAERLIAKHNMFEVTQMKKSLWQRELHKRSDWCFNISGEDKMDLEEELRTADDLELLELEYHPGTSGRDPTAFEMNQEVYVTNDDGQKVKRYKFNHFRGKTKTKFIEQINIEWLYEIFNPVFIEILRQVGQHRMIRVPIGSDKVDNQPPSSVVVPQLYLFYQQRTREYCLAFSIASCLRHMRLVEEAKVVADAAGWLSLLPGETALDCVAKLFREHISSIGQPHIFNRCQRKKEWKEMSIECLVTQRSPYLKIVVPFGNDGTGDHAVAVVDDLVFDSRLQHPLKLIRESLDWVCGIKGCEKLGPVFFFCESFGCGKGGQKRIKKRKMTCNW